MANPFELFGVGNDNTPEKKTDGLDLKILRKLALEFEIECTEEEEQEFLELLSKDKENISLTNDELSSDEILEKIKQTVGGRIVEFLFLIKAKKHISNTFSSMLEHPHPLKSLKETSVFISSILLNKKSLVELIDSISNDLSKNSNVFYRNAAATISKSLTNIILVDLDSGDNNDAQGIYANFLKEINSNQEIRQIVEATLAED